MGCLQARYRAFTLLLRCENCLRASSKLVEVPPGDDSPTCADELVESGFLSNLTFCCGPCGNTIAQVIGIKE